MTRPALTCSRACAGLPLDAASRPDCLLLFPPRPCPREPGPATPTRGAASPQAKAAPAQPGPDPMGLDASALAGGWKSQLKIVQPETVIGWHRKGWRLYWSWRSRSRLGRPLLSPGVRELIARMSRDNPLRGTERIRGELLKLAIVVSNRSIRRYRCRGPKRERRQAWRTFLRNQIKGIWAADLFVVQTIGFQTLYVFFFLRHERREVIHFNVTASPTAAWIWRQVIEATAWGRQPQHLIRDRDNVYGADFGSKRASAGIEDIRTPYRAPLANSVAERVVRNERHLLTLLAEFLGYYNRDRPHRTLVCKRRYQADQSRMASLLLERFSADFITRTAGRHDRCIFAALQPTRVSFIGTGFAGSCTTSPPTLD